MKPRLNVAQGSASVALVAVPATRSLIAGQGSVVWGVHPSAHPRSTFSRRLLWSLMGFPPSGGVVVNWPAAHRAGETHDLGSPARRGRASGSEGASRALFARRAGAT